MPRIRILLLVPVLALAFTACGGGGDSTNGGGTAATTTPSPSPSPSPTPGATDTIRPTTPTGLTATAASSTEINLSWNASSDNVGVTDYQIRRNGTLVGTSNTTSYLDAGLGASTTFSYTVAARDAAGNISLNSTSASATTGVAPPPPPVPSPLAGTALGTLANSMAAGTWAQLNVPNQDAILGVGSVSGTMIHFSNSMPFNPFSKVIEIVGMDHSYPAMRHVRYDVATNLFVLVADNAGVGQGHGYDHNTVNPYTGDLYHRVYSGFTGSFTVRRKVLGGASFVGIPSVAAADQVAVGATWWSGPFVGGGSQGSFMIFNSGNATGNANDGQILAFNPVSNTWFYDQQGKAPFYGGGSTYHSLIEYSPVKNVAVYGGGNVAPSRLWRMSSDGSVLAMPDVPAGKAVGIQKGLLVNDPVSGNFLLLSAGQLWELNPSGSGSWTPQTGSRTPPAGVGDPGPANPEAVIASAISDYGVVAFITQPGRTGATFFLYKHQ